MPIQRGGHDNMMHKLKRQIQCHKVKLMKKILVDSDGFTIERSPVQGNS